MPYAHRSGKPFNSHPVSISSPSKPIGCGWSIHRGGKMKTNDGGKVAGTKTTQAHRVRQASRARREQQKESLGRIILDAAGELFLEQGYEGFSMRRVAERIGYSATTIYRYYEDKDDFLFAVVNEGFSEFARKLTEAAEN